MDPTIEKDGVTFTFNDGDAKQVKVTKQANLSEDAMPASDSDNAFVMDFNGVIKSITVMGKLTLAATSRTDSGDTKTIEEQMEWLMDLVDGAQDGYEFNSTYQTGKTVYARRVTFDENAGDPLRVPFTMELVEGI